MGKNTKQVVTINKKKAIAALLIIIGTVFAMVFAALKLLQSL